MVRCFPTGNNWHRSQYFICRLLTTGTAIKFPAPLTQPAQLLHANETFLAVKLNPSMPGFCTAKNKIIFFMNIIEQTVTRNLNKHNHSAFAWCFTSNLAYSNGQEFTITATWHSKVNGTLWAVISYNILQIICCRHGNGVEYILMHMKMSDHIGIAIWVSIRQNLPIKYHHAIRNCTMNNLELCAHA